MMRLWNRLLQLRRLIRARRKGSRVLQERHVRLFQKRLEELRHDIEAAAGREGFARSLGGYMAEIERRSIELAFEFSDGNLEEVAVLLGVSPEELDALMKRHEFTVEQEER